MKYLSLVLTTISLLLSICACYKSYKLHKKILTLVDDIAEEAGEKIAKGVVETLGKM
ncbi:hypothetical protein IX329_000319 [Fusobacterium necrophorum]|nr:hypothetical protein [Fusobacterium necrophorum]MBR8732748.1 hypothetical protein [Fusobacterium necrophorum]MBR8788925.1 hypothetical protein [Fusobacterium necrophorum]